MKALAVYTILKIVFLFSPAFLIAQSEITNAPSHYVSNCGVNVTATVDSLFKTDLDQIRKRLLKERFLTDNKDLLKSLSLKQIGEYFEKYDKFPYAFKDLSSVEVSRLLTLGKPLIIYLKSKNHFVVLHKNLLKNHPIKLYDYPYKTKKFVGEKELTKHLEKHLPLTALMISDEMIATVKLKSLLIPTKKRTESVKKSQRKNPNNNLNNENKEQDAIKSEDVIYVQAEKDTPELIRGSVLLENTTDSEITNLNISGSCGCFINLPETQNFTLAKENSKKIDLLFNDSEFNKISGTTITLTQTIDDKSKFIKNIAVKYGFKEGDKLKYLTIPNSLTVRGDEKKLNKKVELYIEDYDKNIVDKTFPQISVQGAVLTATVNEEVYIFTKKYIKIVLDLEIDNVLAKLKSKRYVTITLQHEGEDYYIHLPLIVM